MDRKHPKFLVQLFQLFSGKGLVNLGKKEEKDWNHGDHWGKNNLILLRRVIFPVQIVLPFNSVIHKVISNLIMSWSMSSLLVISRKSYYFHLLDWTMRLVKGTSPLISLPSLVVLSFPAVLERMLYRARRCSFYIMEAP